MAVCVLDGSNGNSCVGGDGRCVAWACAGMGPTRAWRTNHGQEWHNGIMGRNGIMRLASPSCPADACAQQQTPTRLTSNARRCPATLPAYAFGSLPRPEPLPGARVGVRVAGLQGALPLAAHLRRQGCAQKRGCRTHVPLTSHCNVQCHCIVVQHWHRLPSSLNAWSRLAATGAASTGVVMTDRPSAAIARIPPCGITQHMNFKRCS